MLEQRRATQKGYITLKEAAEISNYSPDYVGQLIRAGKIKGEQVYSNVAWVTTEDEVRAYLNNKSRSVSTEASKKPFFEQPVFKYFLIGLISLCGISILFLQYILYTTLDDRFDSLYLSESSEINSSS